MRKISKKIINVLLILTILVSSFSMGFESKASGLEFYLDYAEPATSESQGYITFLLYNSNTNQYTTNTWFWTTYASTSSGAESPAYACIENITSRGFEFTIGGVGAASSAYYSLSCYNGTGKCMIYKYSNTERYYHTFSSYVTVCGFQYAGNVGRIIYTVDPNTFTVNFNQDGSAILLQSIISTLLDIRNLDSSILTTVNNILNSVDGVENQLSTLTTYLRSALGNIDTKLANLLDKADRLIAEQEESNTWLEKIWISIQRLFKGDNVEDDTKVEEFGSSSSTQSDKINDLNQQNKVEKVDPSGASSNVDSHIDTEAIGNYGTVLSVFTGNTHILQYILIVLAVALIAYVLFGKR